MEDTASYFLTRLLLQRGIALVYVIAFAAIIHQFIPLLGENGLLPVSKFVRATPFWRYPSLFQFFPKDLAFQVCGFIGFAVALLALFGITENFGTPVSIGSWLLLWILYLSFNNVGQTFFAFGWESLLLEAGFFAMFLGAAHTAPPVITIWIMRWILFRLMFGAGLIKLRGDSCWHDLTCLFYHYETQPMPNSLSWFFHHLPGNAHKLSVLMSHFIQLIVPFFLFLGKSLPAVAGILTIFYQGMLLLSGNLSWLNLIPIVLAFSAFNDAQLKMILPMEIPSLAPLSPVHHWVIMGLAVMTALLSIRPVLNMLSPRQMMNASFNPLHLVNTYGAFGTVTKKRNEIVLEGTSDSVLGYQNNWKEYEIPGKPTAPGKIPPQIAPYHYRLGWMMWFAAFSPNIHDNWFTHLVYKLLQNDPNALKLLKHNPFPDHPPKYVRALYYHYRFTTPEERKLTGDIWHRDLLGEYLPPVSLNDPKLVDFIRQQGWERRPKILNN